MEELTESGDGPAACGSAATESSDETVSWLPPDRSWVTTKVATTTQADATKARRRPDVEVGLWRRATGRGGAW
jgi:hypothetical protein